MPTIQFTMRGLEAIKPDPKQRVVYWDASLGGSFGLRVTPTGHKSWIVVYRLNGQCRRHTIGDYRKISLAEARDVARTIFYSLAIEKSKNCVLKNKRGYK